MANKWIAIIASVLAIAVLAILIAGSRSIDGKDFDAHYQKTNTIDQSIANFESLIDQMSASRRDGRPTGSGVSLMRSRLSTSTDSISRLVDSDDPEVQAKWSAFDTEANLVIELSSVAENQQNAIGNALQYIRDNGPREVQKLKASGFDAESQGFYKLLLKALSAGTPGTAFNREEIESSLAHVKENDGLLSTSVLSMIDSIEQVVSMREPADISWKTLNDSKLALRANELRNAFSGTFSSRMVKAENSRILLSIFSVLLFGGLGLLGYRLQNSYREINEVNDQLLQSNDGLEKRVAERTSDLEKAFDELKESQVQLVQAEKMSSLGQLVAGISHEINTPLLYLQSNQTLIKETLQRVEQFVDLCHDKLVPRAAPTDDKEVIRQRYVQGLQTLKTELIDEEIKEEIHELLTLTDDNMEGLEELTHMAQGLKDFSRLDRAPIDSFNVNDGIKRTLVIAKNVLKNKVEVIQNLNEVPSVSCSPSQINQIFLNLITNAAQAIEGSGEITITTGSDNGYVSVAVTDTGCGIPEEIMTKIRDPFFTTKEVGTGTGLGLSICEEILRSHNGRLDIQSEIGVGSTFTVLLPVQSEKSDGLDMDLSFPDEEASDDNTPKFVALAG